jgi:hypothetical protein
MSTKKKKKAASAVVIARTCAWCGREMAISQRTGRPRRYCSKNCRNRASEARTTAPRLALQLSAGRLATGPVREVVERTVIQPLTPTDAHGWTAALTELARQLADPASKVSREHWQHRRILTALADVTAALDRAHPGGLGRAPRR